MTYTNNSPTASDGLPEDLTVLPAWLIQYNPRSALELQHSWVEGTDTEYPAVDRNAEGIGRDDIVLFWVSGPAAKAGVFAYGVASGRVEEREHPKSYHDPDGARALRTSAEVDVADVFANPIITRAELKRLPEFADFELFRMPNRTNAFVVTRQQWAIILDRISKVSGE